MVPCAMKRLTKRERERLTKKVLDLGNNRHVLKAIERTIARQQKRVDLITVLPMRVILDKLPVSTPSARARLLGITRQAYYDWLNDKWRPNLRQAAKLAELTGVSVKEIRGRE